MDLTIKRVKEILIEAFPHWSQWDVDGLASFLMAFFKEEIKKDASYVVAATSELYSYFEEKVVGQGKIEKRDVRPGLVVHYLKSYPSFTKELKTLYKDKKLEEYYKQKYQEIDAVLVIEEVFSRYLDVDSMDPIVAFIEAIDAQVPFTKSQMPFWAIMREVAFECKGAPVEYFWIMVKERCLEGGIATNDVQWRQMKSRILRRIQNYGSAAAGMLQMVSAEELAIRKLLNVVSDIQRNNDINRILSEYQWPDPFRNDVSIIVKLVIQILSAPNGYVSKDDIHSKYEEEVEELVSILQDFDQSYFNDIFKDTFLTDTSLLVKACLLILLPILKDLNEEEMKILKDWIHA